VYQLYFQTVGKVVIWLGTLHIEGREVWERGNMWQGWDARNMNV